MYAAIECPECGTPNLFRKVDIEAATAGSHHALICCQCSAILQVEVQSYARTSDLNDRYGKYETAMIAECTRLGWRPQEITTVPWQPEMDEGNAVQILRDAGLGHRIFHIFYARHRYAKGELNDGYEAA
jgi:hypothetical protein